MPTRTRRCKGCRRLFDVLEHNGELFVIDKPEDCVCPHCEEPIERSVAVLSKSLGTGILLGGSAGVGRNFPYRDRGLGIDYRTGQFIEVQSHQHREHLMSHWPSGREREIKLMPLDEKPSLSRTSGVWDEIADRDEEEAQADEVAHAEMVSELSEGPNREAYHKTQEHMARMLTGQEPAPLEVNTPAPAPAVEVSDAQVG